MQYQPNFKDGIDYAKQWLRRNGHHMTTESWQGVHKPREMFEAFDFAMKIPLNVRRDITLDELREQIKPNLPWADIHYAERVSGIPYNPPPSNSIWPGGNVETSKLDGGIFSHTYPERYWPSYAGSGLISEKDHIWDGNYEAALSSYSSDHDANQGIRYRLGSLGDLINLIYKEPHTRQAYLPVWFPEDTGAVEGQRVPCTLGYLFRVVEGYIHITYKIRSCDFYRHFRDDLYLTCRLLIGVLDQLKSLPNSGYNWNKVKLGYFKIQIDSLHTFGLESAKL